MGGMKSLEERFWKKVAPTGFCWEWTAARDKHGYGVFNKGPKLDRAHRVAYELLVGPIPARSVIDHLCRNTKCCNPDHLEPVAHKENLLRCYSPAIRTHVENTCRRGHSMEDAYVRPDTGARMCRTCARERRRKRANS